MATPARPNPTTHNTEAFAPSATEYLRQACLRRTRRGSSCRFPAALDVGGRGVTGVRIGCNAESIDAGRAACAKLQRPEVGGAARRCEIDPHMGHARSTWSGDGPLLELAPHGPVAAATGLLRNHTQLLLKVFYALLMPAEAELLAA